MARVVLGVAGGIAAYKSAFLLRLLTEAGHDVRVVPTASALRFVGAATLEALSHHPVTAEVFDDVDQVAHVRIGQEADLIVVAPATADLLARTVHGRADDLLAATLLVARCPVLLAPAMHTEMWENPATAANVASLRERGILVLPPGDGRLTGTDTGPGRMPEPAEIADLVELVLHAGPEALRPDLVGRRVLISAGGTREPLDPVRFLGNRSSGKQGLALARVAAARGADVTLVAANVDGPPPGNVRLITVSTAEQLRAEMHREAKQADVVVMAAAVADFRPTVVSDGKIKKKVSSDPEPVVLSRNPDILREVVGDRHPGQVVVGFAAETGDANGTVLDHGAAKLISKGVDVLVINEVGADLTFDRPDNAATILSAEGGQTSVPRGPKAVLAARLWDIVTARLADPGSGLG
ncbi:MAG: bifunctional phosphopantothenoylcysteine decarboxylase/phosphopantothenate--cysteine ligase CoaBC [Geodermatophilaceae bacterium]|nr:bifunctional phosphopantothenoylcysteine decarboxylase/phosphopantothenate--cysteine ligase CoaBC [Geodermatophilaceae bacterium]MDQ3477214.1 bifunctional phosphopantothenoylcysteine decarboxylase/phosphopantothenate--cysteine ligase CoaBC [Actinomycetota bacterium]